MGSNPYSNQFDLNLKPSFVPQISVDILPDLQKIPSVVERLKYLENYLRDCKEELSRVEVSKHEIQKTMLVLKGALEIMKDNMTKTSLNVNNDDLDRMHIDEFFARKKGIYDNEHMKINSSFFFPPSSSSSRYDAQPCNGKRKEIEIHHEKKPDDYFSLKYHDNNISRNVEVDTRDGLIQENLMTPNNNNQFSGENNNSEQVDEEFNKDPNWKGNARRTWTLELHSLFVRAVNDIGGAEAASPKLIKLRMNVENLTTDQIKSHLQKYRNHLRSFNLNRRSDVRINGPDRRNLPSRGNKNLPARPLDHNPRARHHDHDHDRHYRIPNLNIKVHDDDDQPPQPPPRPAAPVNNNNLSTAAGDDDVANAEPIDERLVAWVNRYFRANSGGGI